MFKKFEYTRLGDTETNQKNDYAFVLTTKVSSEQVTGFFLISKNDWSAFYLKTANHLIVC